MNKIAKTKLGQLSVGLNAFFLLAMIIGVLLAKILKILSFGDHWWDVTVAIIFPASIIALITGIIAIKFKKDKSVLVYVSIFVGVCTVLFILTHSLYIND